MLPRYEKAEKLNSKEKGSINPLARRNVNARMTAAELENLVRIAQDHADRLKRLWHKALIAECEFKLGDLVRIRYASRPWKISNLIVNSRGQVEALDGDYPFPVEKLERV